MKRSSRSSLRRRFILLASAAIAALAWAAWSTSATDDDKKQGKTSWTGYVFFGGAGVDKEGLTGISGLSAGRVAEYMSAKSSPFFGGDAFYDDGSTYWRLGGFFFTDEEGNLSLSGSAGRVFLTSTGLNRFLHRLDNDRASDWSENSTVNLSGDSAGLDTMMQLTDLSSANRFKIPSLPGLTLQADLHALWRSGDRQARTFDHCTACHVTAAAQGLGRRTTGIRLGAELVRSGVALRYSHTERTYDDASDALTHDYLNIFGNFDLEGIQPFAVTPDNSHRTDRGAARIDLSTYGSVVFKARKSSTTNKSTDYSADSTRLSGLLTFKPAPWLNLRGRYDRREETNDTPLASERTLDRFDGALTLRPVRALKLEGSYRWDRVDRSGGTELERTTTKSYRFKGILRPDNKWRLTASWRHADVEDPFGRVLRNSFSRIEDVFLSPLGTDEDDMLLTVTYSPVLGSSLTASYSWRKTENPSVNLDAKTQFLSFAGSYAANKKVTLTGSFSHYANDVDRDVYLGVLAPLLEIVSVPYEGRGTTAQAGLWFDLGGGFHIRPGYAYTRAESSFGEAELGNGVAGAAAVDATMQRFELESSKSLTESLELWLGYMLDDYSEANLADSDGTVHWFFGGFTYKF